MAPPGSGKTTLVAPWLMRSGLAGDGEIVLLQPRRVATRAVARRIAAALGEPVGRRVGYQVRFDTKVGPETRIRVVTEGILTAWLQRDPELRGVAAVVLDEFHERSIHADLALAFCREIQEALRDDLLLVVMSATLDPTPVAAYLGGCPVVTSDGRLHPVAIDYRPAAAGAALSEGVKRGVLALIDEGTPGDVLTFLPGVAEIEACREALAGPLATRGYDLQVLHGRLEPSQQDRALEPGPRSRVVLSTNIAETSLTIQGIGAVVDSGLAKVMRYEPRLGTGRLQLERISQASADQRAGRAGRLGPGRALRLWSSADQRSMAQDSDPEIRRVDLGAVVLNLLAWGVDPRTFEFFEAPDAARLERSLSDLALIGVIDGSGGLSALGRKISGWPVPPRIGVFMARAAAGGAGPRAGWWGAVCSERTSSRALTITRRVADVREQRHSLLARQARRLNQLAQVASTEGSREALLRALVSAWPDRVCRRRAAGSAQVLMVGGRAARLPAEATSGASLAVAVELDAGRRRERASSIVRLCEPIDVEWLRDQPGYGVSEVLRWDEERDRVVAERVESFLDLQLDRRPVPLTDRSAGHAVFAEVCQRDPQRALGTLDAADDQVVARLVTLARLRPDLSLPADRTQWLARAVEAAGTGCVALSELRARRFGPPLVKTLPWPVRRAFEDDVPQRIAVPSGSRIALRYSDTEPPVLAVKVQEIFGLATSPTIAGGRQRCVLHLLNPAGRPLQVTRDLQSFWSVTWPEVRGEMRSRYPKHHWPEDPHAAQPSRRTTSKGRRR